MAGNVRKKDQKMRACNGAYFDFDQEQKALKYFFLDNLTFFYETFDTGKNNNLADTVNPI